MAKFKVGDRVRDEESFATTIEGVVTKVERHICSDFLWLEGQKNPNTYDGSYDVSGFSLISSPHVSPGDTVRLVSGGPFTSGLHTATVDNVTSDGVVLLTTGGWLTGDLVEKAEALTVEATAEPAPAFKVGDKVRIVRKVEKEDGWENGWTYVMDGRVGDGSDYTISQINEHGVRFEEVPLGWPPGSLELAPAIAEPIATALAAAKINVKVGDTIRALVNDCDTTKGSLYKIIEVEDGAAYFIDDEGDRYYLEDGDFELATPAPVTPTNDNSLTITISATTDFNALADQFQRVADAIRAAA